MLSRRNIRVKVMQTLYSIESMDHNTQIPEAISILQKNLDQSNRLFTYLVYFLSEISRYAETDSHKKSQKHLPSFGDLNINTKISGNEIIWSVMENESFKKSLKDFNTQSLIDIELVRRIYQSMSISEDYKLYISNQERGKKADKKILEFIFNDLMLANPDFISNVEEYFIHWDDDADMMIVLMANYFQHPASFNFSEIVTQEKWIFAKSLLETVMDKREYCMELIKPKLKNWDSERIASLDMILMRMGICEFLYFETIPPKVTINEYIDLGKTYSTPQSGHFVNGILDNIHKELISENKIIKKNFKNSTL